MLLGTVLRGEHQLLSILEEAGYRTVRRYAGGLEEWRAAGYPLEGTMA